MRKTTGIPQGVVRGPATSGSIARRAGGLALLLLSSLFLASCNGGEDFSDVRLPGCAFGAQCREGFSGTLFVELVGPQVENLRYRCGRGNSGSISHLRAEDHVTPAGVRIPPFTAQCPTGAERIEFFIGSGFFEGNLLSLGSAYIPVVSITGGTTNSPRIMSLTLTDVVESARRVPASDHRVRNLGLLLAALDSDGSGEDGRISIPDELHEVVNEQFETLELSAVSLDAGDESDFRDDFAPLLLALNEARDLLDTDPGYHDFPSDLDDFNQQLQRAMDLSRAGYYVLGYNDNAEIGVLEFVETIKRPNTNFDNLGRFSANLLVLPTGDVIGLGSVLMSVQDGGTDWDVRRDGVMASGLLSNELVFDDLDFEGISLPGALHDTSVSLTGRFLGNVLYNGVPGAQGEGLSDVEIDQPEMPYVPDPVVDFGRLTGQFLGETTQAMIIDDDDDAPGLPVRASRQVNSVIQVDPAILANLDGSRYRVTLMRGCLPAEADDDLCEDFADENDGTYYPARYEVIESVEGEEGESQAEIIFGFEQEILRRDGDIASGAPDTCIEIREEGGNGIIYAGLDGECPVVGNEYAVGYVTRTTESVDEDDDTIRTPESATIVLLLAATAPGTGHTQFGTQIEGRMALQDCGRPLYRLADNNFRDGIRASWADNYLPIQIQSELLEMDDAHDFSDNDDPANQRLISNVQGLINFEYLDGGNGFTCE